MARMTLDQLRAARKVPNVKKYLDLLSYAEGTTKNGYNTTFGGGRIDDLSKHPNVVWGKTGDGPTTSTGRYGFIGPTFNDQQKKLGLPDFGPESQDLAAIGLIAEKGALDDVINGNIDSANKKLSSTWASLPYNTSPNQHQRSNADIQAVWNKLGGNNYDVGQKVQTQVINTGNSNSPVPTELANNAGFLKNVLSSFSTDSQPVRENALDSSAFSLPPRQELSEDPPQTNYREQYKHELAKAFQIQPSTSDLMPDYIGDLVKSIYDQA